MSRVKFAVAYYARAIDPTLEWEVRTEHLKDEEQFKACLDECLEKDIRIESVVIHGKKHLIRPMGNNE